MGMKFKGVINSELDLINQKYARDNFNEKFSTIPVASSNNLGKIVQYIGETTTDYINGYFYKCILDGTTYKWSNIQVQSGGSGVSDYTLLTNKPKINSIELNGNKSLSDLSIASINDLTNKVDKEANKSLILDTDITQITTNKNNIATNTTNITNNTNDITTINNKLDSDITSSNQAQGKTYIDTQDNLKVNKTDIVDNLTSTDTDKPLSANQGKVLNESKIGTAGTGLSKSGTTLNHSNSITAQTTAKIGKIKFDAQGHITDFSELHLYYHNIFFANATSTYEVGFIINTDSNAFNESTFAKWLYDNGFTSITNVYGGIGGLCLSETIFVASSRGGATTTSRILPFVATGWFSSDGTTLTLKYNFNNTVTASTIYDTVLTIF